MLKATFRPLHQWIGPRPNGFVSQFKAEWVETLDLLEYELGRLKAEDIVIQLEDPEAIKLIRNDGSLRPATTGFHIPARSGVIVTFHSPKGAMSMPCARYRFWQDNIRAIALSLKALRAIDRFGVSTGTEQYKGWAQLADPNANHMDRHAALAFLALVSGVNGVVLSQYKPEALTAVIRQQRIAHHPDHAKDPQDRARREELSSKLGEAELALCPPKAADLGGIQPGEGVA